MIRLRARWVFTGRSTPLSNAFVEIVEGRIRRVVAEENGTATDLGNVVLIPGLINSHTHLEFSHLSAPLSPLIPFPSWIARVVGERRSRQGISSSSVSRGIIESFTAGVTGLAEIATEDEPYLEQGQNPPPISCFVFREILGLREEMVDHQLLVASEFLRGMREQGLPAGLSPHAPYSLHPRLFEGLCALAEEEQVPLAMHLAESREEMELLQHGRGALVDLLREWNLWREGLLETGLRPLHFLQALSRAPRVLVIHGNFLDREEVDFLASQPQMSLVYCPRTHTAMQQGSHPWREMIKRGVRVVLGTDSRASNPDLSIWNEMRFLQQQFPEIPAGEILTLGTAAAAEAMGWSDRGEVTAGRSADFCLVSLNDQQIEDPQKHLFHGRLTGVMRAGQWLRKE